MANIEAAVFATPFSSTHSLVLVTEEILLSAGHQCIKVDPRTAAKITSLSAAFGLIELVDVKATIYVSGNLSGLYSAEVAAAWGLDEDAPTDLQDVMSLRGDVAHTIWRPTVDSMRPLALPCVFLPGMSKTIKPAAIGAAPPVLWVDVTGLMSRTEGAAPSTNAVVYVRISGTFQAGGAR